MSTVVIDDDEIRRLLARLPEDVYFLVKDEIENSVLAVHKKVSDGFTESGGLKSRTGMLRRSLITEVSGNDLDSLEGRVVAGGGSAPVKYAILQELGGRITPKNNKYRGVPGGPYINIPLSPNKTTAGVMRKSAREVFNSGGYIRRTLAGKWLVMSHDDKAMFVLSKGVTIPPRLGMKKAMDEETPVLINRIYQRLIPLL